MTNFLLFLTTFIFGSQHPKPVMSDAERARILAENGATDEETTIKVADTGSNSIYWHNIDPRQKFDLEISDSWRYQLEIDPEPYAHDYFLSMLVPYLTYIPELMVGFWLIYILFFRCKNYAKILVNIILSTSYLFFSAFDLWNVIPYGILAYHTTGYSTVVRLLLFFLFLSYLNLITINKSYYRYARITYIMMSFMLFFLITLTTVQDLFLFFLNLEALTYTMIFMFILNSEHRSVLNSIRYFYLNILASSCLLISFIILFHLLLSTDFLSIAYSIDLLSTFTDIDGQYKKIVNMPPSTYNYYFATSLMSEAKREWPSVYTISGAFFVIGCGVKLVLFPFAIFITEFYRRMSYSMMFLIAYVFKIVFLLVWFRIGWMIFFRFPYVLSILNILAIWTLVLGVFLTVTQKTIKKFFILASTCHISVILLCFSAGTYRGAQLGLYYLIIYTLSSIIIFTILVWVRSGVDGKPKDYFWELESLTQLSVLRYDIKSGIAFSLAILTLAGVPPTAGFFGKYEVLTLFLQQGWYVTAWIFLATSLVSLWYYYKIFRIIWIDEDCSRTDTKGLLRLDWRLDVVDVKSIIFTKVGQPNALLFLSIWIAFFLSFKISVDWFIDFFAKQLIWGDFTALDRLHKAGEDIHWFNVLYNNTGEIEFAYNNQIFDNHADLILKLYDNSAAFKSFSAKLSPAGKIECHKAISEGWVDLTVIKRFGPE